jgi:hypothetical protein
MGFTHDSLQGVAFALHISKVQESNDVSPWHKDAGTALEKTHVLGKQCVPGGLSATSIVALKWYGIGYMSATSTVALKQYAYTLFVC